jgi:hypothetical protein
MRVKCLVTEYDVTEGTIYEVASSYSFAGSNLFEVEVRDNVGELWSLHNNEHLNEFEVVEEEDVIVCEE